MTRLFLALSQAQRIDALDRKRILEETVKRERLIQEALQESQTLKKCEDPKINISKIKIANEELLSFCSTILNKS